jgi:type IV secretory pathway protease TraF
MRAGDRQIERGDVVIFRPPFESAYLLNGQYYIKIVGGLAGDEYEVADGVFYLRQAPWGKVYETDSAGNPLKQISSRPFHVKEDCFLPLTPADKSYDGRYYGDIPLEWIQYKVVPIFTY